MFTSAAALCMLRWGEGHTIPGMEMVEHGRLQAAVGGGEGGGLQAVWGGEELDGKLLGVEDEVCKLMGVDVTEVNCKLCGVEELDCKVLGMEALDSKLLVVEDVLCKLRWLLVWWVALGGGGRLVLERNKEECRLVGIMFKLLSV